jgi:hypothetical protein
MSALDQRCISFAQSNRAGLAYVTAKFVEDVIAMIYAAGSGEMVEPIVTPGWKLELKREPNLRVVINIEERKLLDMVRETLRTLGYTVNSMRDRNTESDYLVALV